MEPLKTQNFKAAGWRLPGLLARLLAVILPWVGPSKIESFKAAGWTLPWLLARLLALILPWVEPLKHERLHIATQHALHYSLP